MVRSKKSLAVDLIDDEPEVLETKSNLSRNAILIKKNETVKVMLIAVKIVAN